MNKVEEKFMEKGTRGRRRVVVTGIGFISPLGNDIPTLIAGLKTGACAVSQIKGYDTTGREVTLACEVENFNGGDHFDKKILRRLDRVNQFGIVAARKALEDSGLTQEEIQEAAAGVYVSSGIGGLATIEKEHERGLKNGFDRISPYFIPMAITNLTAANIALELEAHGGCQCPVTACAGSTNAIGEAYRAIKDGYEEIVFAGGSESCITTLGIGGFTSMKALSTAKDPSRGSIPFDLEREGFVMGEGSGILVLEERSRALKRGAKIYGEVGGYGSTCDAYHITSPSPEGEFAAKAMSKAIEEAGISPKDVDYINAHGTSTPLNDKYETLAIKRVFGHNYKDVAVSSSKSQMGHLLGASGALESIVTLLAMGEGFMPTTVNYQVPDKECDLNLITNEIIEKPMKIALKNSLGFGGHNGTLLYKKWEGQ